MIDLRTLNIALIDSPNRCSRMNKVQAELAGQRRTLHLGLVQRECRSLTTLALDIDMASKLVRFETDMIIIDAGDDEETVLQALHDTHAETLYPVICFNEDSSFRRMRSALEGGVAAYVTGSLSVERIRMVLGVAMARFEINQKLQRELLETRRRLAALGAQSILDELQLKC